MPPTREPSLGDHDPKRSIVAPTPRLDASRIFRTLLLASAALAAIAFLYLLPTLFMAIPYPIRKGMGMSLFLALLAAGLVRLLRIRPGDRWPLPSPRTVSEGRTASLFAHGLPWILALATATLAYPLLNTDGPRAGFGDWDHHLQKFEAIRLTILGYGQFPCWTPWTCGGFPLAAEPECGVVSLATPAVLFFGSGVGLRIATIACLAVAVEGARRLGRLWLVDPWAAVAAGAVYGLPGGILVYTVAGHFIPMSFCATPWLIYFACRIAERPADGAALGAWAAFDVLNGISYPSVYGLILATLLGLRAVVVAGRARRALAARHTALALGVFLLLAGWRLGVMAAVLRDYPRIQGSFVDLRVIDILTNLVGRPDPSTLRRTTSTTLWGVNCCIGWLGAALLILSLRDGWRWWHTLAVSGFLLALGTYRWWHPSLWLSDWPVFSTMHMVTRWIVPTMLGVGLAIASTIAWARASASPTVRFASCAAVVVLVADLILCGHRILPVALAEQRIPSQAPMVPPSSVESAAVYPAILRGQGIIRAHEPLLGYDRIAPPRGSGAAPPATSARLGRPTARSNRSSGAPIGSPFKLAPARSCT